MGKTNNERTYYMERVLLTGIQTFDATSGTRSAPVRSTCRQINISTSAGIDSSGCEFRLYVSGVDTGIIAEHVGALAADTGAVIQVPPGVTLEQGDGIQLFSNGNTTTVSDMYFTFVMDPLDSLYPHTYDYISGGVITDLATNLSASLTDVIQKDSRLVGITSVTEGLGSIDAVCTIFKNRATTGATVTFDSSLGANDPVYLEVSDVIEFRSGDSFNLQVSTPTDGGATEAQFTLIFAPTTESQARNNIHMGGSITNVGAASSSNIDVVPLDSTFVGLLISLDEDITTDTVITFAIDGVTHSTYTLDTSHLAGTPIFLAASSRIEVAEGQHVQLSSDGATASTGYLAFMIVLRE